MLCGRAYYGTMTGALRINGEPGRILDHRKRVGFVPQDDIVHDDLTVEENLRFSAMLRLPHRVEKNVYGKLQKFPRRLKVQKVVNDALEVLQIGHIKD